LDQDRPHRISRVPAFAAALLLFAATAKAEIIRATTHSEGQTRTVQVVREGDDIFIPVFACGALLGADTRWDKTTNRWEMRGKTAQAHGFLDEPLLTVSGQPFIVRTPPRLINSTPYLSIEALRLLGRHGWETDVTWEAATKEIFVRPAQAAALGLAPRARTIAVPQVPDNARIVALDPGHSRQSGAQGIRGTTEGDMGLRFCTALSATLTGLNEASVILRGEGDDLTPAEAASLANAIRSDLMVSFHGSVFGKAGVAVWYWGLANIGGTGINFAPFEPAGGWVQAAGASSSRSLALARRIIKSLKDAGIPVRGPYPAPLAALEGVTCPAVVLDFQGLSTSEGAALVNHADSIEKITLALLHSVQAEPGPRPERQ
jgi:N-acetylmuramoyl-L-alanine amidase